MTEELAGKWDVVVVGAGPSGSMAARGFAKAGLRVLLLEEHAEVGAPVHCTGVVGNEILERFPEIKSCVWRPLERFKIHSPEGKHFFLPGVKAFALNRKQLDRLLAHQAESQGAELLLNHKVISITRNDSHVLVTAQRLNEVVTFQSKLAVLAAGSKSHLSRRSGLEEPPQFIRGVQVEAEIENLECVELYLGEDVAPGSFAWGVPTDGNKAKIGLITIGNARIHLDKLFESRFLKGRVNSLLGKPLVSRIPLGPSPVSSIERVLAVGDAAGQVKTTTGGGIYYGLLGAEAAVSTALRGYKNGDFHEPSVRACHFAWKEVLGLELKAGLVFRNLFRKVNDSDLNRLTRLFQREDMQRILSRHADFDRHRKLIFALFKVPSFRSVLMELLWR